MRCTPHTIISAGSTHRKSRRRIINHRFKVIITVYEIGYTLSKRICIEQIFQFVSFCIISCL